MNYEKHDTTSSKLSSPRICCVYCSFHCESISTPIQDEWDIGCRHYYIFFFISTLPHGKSGDVTDLFTFLGLIEEAHAN